MQHDESLAQPHHQFRLVLHEDQRSLSRQFGSRAHHHRRWGLVLRQPIYEKDRVDAIDPAARLEIDPAALAKFPAGYRHLAFIQTQLGYTVKMDMPQLTGPEVQALYARGKTWLAPHV